MDRRPDSKQIAAGFCRRPGKIVHGGSETREANGATGRRIGAGLDKRRAPYCGKGDWLDRIGLSGDRRAGGEAGCPGDHRAGRWKDDPVADTGEEDSRGEGALLKSRRLSMQMRYCSYGRVGAVMNSSELILQFVERAGADPILGPSHIGLYLAIVLGYERQGGRSPVSVYSRVLMRVAKVSAAGTYAKCMRDLQAGGHIRYVQSYNPAKASLVYLSDK